MTEYLTVTDISNILKISRNKSYELVSAYNFPKVVIGKCIRIPKEEFEKYMKHNLYKKID